MSTNARFKNLIGGKWADAESGKTFFDVNPSNKNHIIGEFPKSDYRDVDKAVACAKKAFHIWRKVPAPKRGEILYKAGELLLRKKEEFARELSQEMGKILDEGRGDVQEAIDTAFYAGGEGRRLFGLTTPSELKNKFAMAMRSPIGVCGLITPWNFPMAIPSWKIFPALLCGNTIVFKPASDTPLLGTRLVEILVEAGIPEGVVNLVHGGGNDVGIPIIEHRDVRVLSFTGSTAIGRMISEKGGKMLKKVCLEMGGKNAQLVMDDANLELALEGSLWGAFATAGQRCTATSRIIVHKDIKSKYIEALISRTKNLKLGDAVDPNTKMGPLVNEGQREIVHSYVQQGIRGGARLLCGGKYAEAENLRNGFFYEPTLFDEPDQNSIIAQEEIFGPVACILTCENFEDGVQILNNSRYGLSSSIYTQDVNRAFKSIENFEAGIVYINGPTIGAETHLPFGGVKETGNGHREACITVYDFYSEWKTVYVDYSGKLQRAQIDA